MASYQSEVWICHVSCGQLTQFNSHGQDQEPRVGPISQQRPPFAMGVRDLGQRAGMGRRMSRSPR